MMVSLISCFESIEVAFAFLFNFFSDSHDVLMRRFVRKKRMVVVSVEYVHNLACYRTVSLKILLRLNK